MKEFIIGASEEGIRLDKQLIKILDNAGSGFIYKMLRKKNITLNDKKASGNEHLKDGDSIKIYLADDTFEKFSSKALSDKRNADPIPDISDKIVYEDDSLILVNKPSGILSQKANADDISINEMCLSYLLRKGELTDDKLKLFKPSVCNRLDRNTSGMIIFAKNYTMAAAMGKALFARTIHKYYLCVTEGIIKSGAEVISYLEKDEKSNKVRIYDEEGAGRARIHTAYRPLKTLDGMTLLEVDLITGKSHQIRAQMAALNHPLIGDVKYGGRKINNTSSQLLHAYKLVIPDETEEQLKYLSGKTFIAPPTGNMKDILKETFNIDDYRGL